jgi:hypothetical protein
MLFLDLKSCRSVDSSSWVVVASRPWMTDGGGEGGLLGDNDLLLVFVGL